MGNGILNRVVIAVNKRNKLLGYLRKLKSGDTKRVSIKIIDTPKGKPINLFFAKSVIRGDFIVWTEYGEAGDKKIVVLGDATIESLEKIGYVSAGNRESKECVAINVYTKEDALDVKDLQDILFKIKRLTTYGLVSTSVNILVELKPENKNIINYEVSMLPINPSEPLVDKKINSTVTESEKYTQEALRQRHRRIDYTLEIVIAKSILKSDLKKPLKRWNKILKAEPIEILTDTFSNVGHILGFYIKESSNYGANGVTINNGISKYELVAKYTLSDSYANSRDRGIATPSFVLKALHNAYIKYKQRKSENLNISRLESLLEENQEANNQDRDKDLIGIIAETLREIEGLGKAKVNKCSKTASKNLFCKSNKKNNNTAHPYQAPHPTVTILVDKSSKDKAKEIIEEANKTKNFPYMLDYDSNCVVKISDNLFNILECRNKLEDILKIKEDIDVGIAALEPTGGLTLKKSFNISSLAVYYSDSKKLYALIGIC